ncbi:MAG: folate family ECF transporter S component [Oscillospiraceae bacterium]|nr:folate family ECF transporter S component [Oscillospiraceae bacterium]
MSRIQKSTAVYKTPFSAAYWRDAAAELKDTKMLVVTALMIALRVALKPLAIPLGPQLSIQTAMLATALGAMIYGPVVAIPAAMISDTVGFMIYPTGDYFLPFMLTEIASTMFYAIFLYRAEKVTPIRVMLSRFCICLFVNVILQQFIYAWWYTYIGNPEQAKEQILGIMTVARIFKNLAMFPIEAVVLTLFLRFLMPVCKRARLVFSSESDMKFDKKQIITLVCLILVGSVSAVSYMAYRYSTSSRSADYKTEERVAIQKSMADLVLEKTDDWDEETVITIVDSAYRGLFESDTDYTVAVYVLDEEAFAAGQAEDESYTMDTLWKYSKSGPKKDKYQSLIKVASCDIVKNEKTGEILEFVCTPVE